MERTLEAAGQVLYTVIIALFIALIFSIAAEAHDMHGLTHDHASPVYWLLAWAIAGAALWIWDTRTDRA